MLISPGNEGSIHGPHSIPGEELRPCTFADDRQCHSSINYFNKQGGDSISISVPDNPRDLRMAEDIYNRTNHKVHCKQTKHSAGPVELPWSDHPNRMVSSSSSI